MRKIKMSILLGIALLGATQVMSATSNEDLAKKYADAYNAINDVSISNDKSAVEVLSGLANENYPQAIMAMGQVYCYGISTAVDFEKAKSFYTQAINLGCPGAVNGLQECEMRQGYYSRIDQIREGVKQGDAKSLGELGICYANGIDVPCNNNRAIECFNLGAEKSDALSMYELGVRYFLGYGVAQDFDKAVKWFKKSAQAGNANAQYQMALMYEEATPLEKNNELAVAWYDKAIAQNHVGALYNTALHYFNGSLREVNTQKAIELLEKASEKGSAEAAYLLGYIYEKGESVIADANKALLYYQMAFNNGSTEAAVGIGRVYAVILNDKVKANEWFDKAVKYGSLQGEYYRNLMNCSNEIKTLEKKSKDGNIEATKTLALCYYEGIGAKKDYKKAFKYMKKAAEKDRNANYQLGMFYAQGVGIKKDYKKAVECFKIFNNKCAEVALFSNATAHQSQVEAYKQASLSGNAEAYYMMYLCYKYGFGVNVNNHLSHEMLVCSASKGHVPAQRQLSAYWLNKGDAYSKVKSECWQNKYQIK